MIPLQSLQELYDRHRFIELYEQSKPLWSSSTQIEGLSVEELILGGRLAYRLGGARLSRYLFRAAYERDPFHPQARYYCDHVRRRRPRMLDELRNFEKEASDYAADPATHAGWCASRAVTWAYLRDFKKAHEFLARAREREEKDGWVTSCLADVLGLEDRWDEALQAAEQSWEMNPGAPFAARTLGNCLLNLRRVQDSAAWLARAAEGCQSYEIVHLAGWHHCALAETLEGPDRDTVLNRAREIAARLPALMPLIDRETRILFARMQLDIAELAGDHGEIERWAGDIRILYYRRVLENLRKNRGKPRIRLPFSRAVQKYEACLPTSLASAVGTQGAHLDPDVMAAEITFGGTTEWAAAAWLEERGFAVRFFSVTPEIAALLIQRGIGFVLTLESDDNAHAVAVVGLDEATGTLLIHDPMAFRTTEYLMEVLAENQEPLGIKAMAVVPREKAALLDEVLPKESVTLMTAVHAYGRALTLQGPSAGREIVEKLAKELPGHPGTRFLLALQAVEDGRIGEALLDFQELLKEFPQAPQVRARLVTTCRMLGNTALMRETLAGVVERGTLPGIHSQQDWLYPPARYVAQYAELLHYAAGTRARAATLLHSLLRRFATSGDGWHALADLLWEERDTDGALLAYGLASFQETSNEHYARAYCDALCRVHRQDEGFSWLQERVRRFGGVSHAASAWITWIRALEEWGYPERALAVCAQALREQEEAPELLAFSVSFLARMGSWKEAGQLLGRLEETGNLTLSCPSAVDFHGQRGDLEKALQHAQAWIRETPRDINARYALADAVAKRDGPRAAAELALRWMAENPGHDDLEVLCYRRMDGPGGSRWKKYSILRRRVKRNPEDGWAWRELTFCCINDYEQAGGRAQERLARHVARFLAECDRTAPDDAATIRVHARWREARAEWPEAVAGYLESIELDPTLVYGYQRVWDCSTRLNAGERQRLAERIEPLLLRGAGHLAAARDLVILLAQRFGVEAAEQAVARWKEARPDDPEVTQAFADLLLDRGQGRTDAARALAMLQPAVEKYPHSIGLRFSLSLAHRRLGDFARADEVLSEILRRHPGDSNGHVQRAWVRESHGKVDEALALLESAAARDPQNTQIHDTRAQMLIRAGRFTEARRFVEEVLRRQPEDLSWRERAISLLLNCGDEPGAVAAAREGVRLYPRAAFPWFLLGSLLQQVRRFAGPGEIEECLRRGLALNSQYFDAADLLTIHLVEQRRYEEACEVMHGISSRLCDPAPAQGRLAWIHRQQGKKSEALDEIAGTVSAGPWYLWGWLVLMDWLVEDRAWDRAQNVLGEIPPQLRANTQFRQQRLLVLERAGIPASDLDAEWKSLLSDFPEELSLHLQRYDILKEAKRASEAHAVLQSILPFAADSPYFLARRVEMLLEQDQKEEALETLQRLFLAEAETSTWPADNAWSAVKKAKLEEAAYQKLRRMMESGMRPAPRAFYALANSALTRGGTQARARQPAWRILLPDRGARELQSLLRLVDRAPWGEGRYRAILFDQLSGAGYNALVIKYWRKHRHKVEQDVATWAETARALVGIGRFRDARKLLSTWQSRAGVSMWVVTNYVCCFSPLWPPHQRKIVEICRAALASLPHDHCARYLAHVLAESCALLGDTAGFRETWEQYRPYFDGKLADSDWFQDARRHMLVDIPQAAKDLEQGRKFAFWLKVWGWRLKHIGSIQIGRT